MSNADLPSAPPITILIAEDSPTQAKRLQYILERQGYTVVPVTNGRLALEAARRLHPTLVISDVVMPEMNGYELCRSIKTEPALADTPVILVTTLSDPQDVIRGLECRADNFILKPYDERHLLSRVQFVLINREARQMEHSGMGVEIFFNGLKHFITADRLQILNLLLSTYDAAIQRNRDLTRAQDDLNSLNSRLEAANRELESFSFSVSHDLRTPLRHISGFVELLEQSAAAKLDAREKGYVDRVVQATRNMSELIDDLLEFSRMGRAELRRTPVAAGAVVREAQRRLEPETKGRAIAWSIGTLPTVQADPAMLQQVFVNLLANAIKYTRPRERAEIAVGAMDEADEAVLFVRDNGVGFDMEYADKLFGVFQRLHSKDEFEGTGIGLANVRRIVARHGGRTWAEGHPGEGATFYFSLPKATEPAA